MNETHVNCPLCGRRVKLLVRGTKTLLPKHGYHGKYHSGRNNECPCSLCSPWYAPIAADRALRKSVEGILARGEKEAASLDAHGFSILAQQARDTAARSVATVIAVADEVRAAHPDRDFAD